MDLQKTQFDQLSHLLQSSLNTSEKIVEISGEDKTTVALLTVGITLTVAGLLRSMNF